MSSVKFEWSPTGNKKYITEDNKPLTAEQSEKWMAIADSTLADAYWRKCEEENRTPEMDEWVRRGIYEGQGIDTDEL